MKTWKRSLCIFATLLLLLTGCSEPDAPEEVKQQEPASEQPVDSIPLIPGVVGLEELAKTYEKQRFSFKTEYWDNRSSYFGQKNHENGSNYFCSIKGDGELNVSVVSFIINGSNQSKEKVDELVKEFFGQAARLQYEQADPDQAQKWVEQHASTAIEAGQWKVTKTKIGSVEFELTGEPLVRVLLIKQEGASATALKMLYGDRVQSPPL